MCIRDRANIVPETIVAGELPGRDEEIPIRINTVQEAERTEMQLREWKRTVANKAEERRVKPRLIQPMFEEAGFKDMGEYFEKVIEFCDKQINTSTPEIREIYMKKKASMQANVEKFRAQQAELRQGDSQQAESAPDEPPPIRRGPPDDDGVSHTAPGDAATLPWSCLLYTSPSPRDLSTSRMPSSA